MGWWLVWFGAFFACTTQGRMVSVWVWRIAFISARWFFLGFSLLISYSQRCCFSVTFLGAAFVVSVLDSFGGVDAYNATAAAAAAARLVGLTLGPKKGGVSNIVSRHLVL
ncbi:hypothetical protein B0H67DRAFT_312359 [Lasiosphaeris hirsuta]|uniref:Uncharacterized protein n=1 Tax=Lasiosphaeris hirsuta TaxID=260670 RepID=A0AA40A1E3_9PEZI|nr:hypothetical protein B0H67DRAFT_312359 [Lasiosphaeris hirsuta]